MRYLKVSLLVFMVVGLLLGFSSIGVGDTKTRMRSTWSWPTQIDPAVGSDYSSSTALTNLYDTVVYPTADGSVEPHLAKSWEISEGGLVYTFQLKKGVKFHNGDELTAQDVKFSMERLLEVGEGYAYLFKGKVENVEVLGDYEIRFELSETFGPFLSTLVRLYIVNKEKVMENLKDGPYGNYGDYGKEFLNTHDAGTGAYKVKEFSVGSYLLLEKFPGYFGYLAPNTPDEFKMIGTTKAITVRTMMSKRKLEISDQWQTLEGFRSLEKINGVDLVNWPDGGQLYLMLNTKLPPLDDIHVRKALSYAFDYTTLVERLYPGFPQAQGPVSRVFAGHNSELFQYQKDLDKAKEELKKSKYYGELNKYPIEYAWTAEVPDLEKIALMLQADCEKIGLDIKVKKTPWMKMIDRAAKKETTPHITSIWVSPHYPEAGSLLETKYHSSNTGSWEQTEWLENDKIDKLIERALGTRDREKRTELYKEIQERIVELVPSIFCFDNLERHAYQSDYVDWPQVEAEKAIPVMGYMFDMRFTQIYPEKRAELLGK